jgi:hypothetical protein
MRKLESFGFDAIVRGLVMMSCLDLHSLGVGKPGSKACPIP